MNRHLLPDEIDLLLDNEEGFGVAPLRSHLEQCPSCQVEFDALARVVGLLERVPHLRPAPLFAERVMTRVEVYQPWHVAARDFVGGLIPQSSAGRVLAGGLGVAAAGGMTAGLLWVGQRADAALFVGSYALERTRDALAAGVADLAHSLAGPIAATSIQNGGTLGLVATGAAATVSVLLVAAGVKALATSARSRRS